MNSRLSVDERNGFFMNSLSVPEDPLLHPMDRARLIWFVPEDPLLFLDSVIDLDMRSVPLNVYIEVNSFMI